MKEKIKIFIFTTVFSGGKNKNLFIFTPVFLGEKMKNFIFTPVLEKEGNIFQAMTGFLAHFPVGMGILYPVVSPQCIHHQKPFTQ